MRKAHDSYLTQVERDARKREAERKAEEERLRRNEVSTRSPARAPCQVGKALAPGFMGAARQLCSVLQVRAQGLAAAVLHGRAGPRS